MKKTIATALIALAMAHPATAQQIAKYRPGTATPGAVYMLPKTALRFTVRAERTIYTPGQFARYAKRYMKLDNVPQQPSEKWRVLTIDMLATAVPDTAKCYRVAINPKTSAPNFALSDDGILLGINADVQQKPLPEPFKPAPKPAQKDPRQYLNEDVLVAASTAKQAELTAQDIYDLRDNRNLLTRGQADFMPKDGEQLRLMLASLDRQDKAMTGLFAGITERDTIEQVFTIVPQGPIDKQVLFRLSPKLGLVGADDLSGTPYYVSVKPLVSVPAMPPADPKAKKKKPASEGIFVNVPAKIEVQIVKNAKAMGTFQVLAAQYGYTELLSPDLFNKRYDTVLRLNPTTGGVEKIETKDGKK